MKIQLKIDNPVEYKLLRMLLRNKIREDGYTIEDIRMALWEANETSVADAFLTFRDQKILEEQRDPYPPRSGERPASRWKINPVMQSLVEESLIAFCEE